MRYPKVLVFTPFTHDVNPTIQRRHLTAVAALDYNDYHHVMLPNAYPHHPQRFGNHARARNEMIEAIDHKGPVLWVDSDIVELPVDLIQRLLDRLWGEQSIHIVAPVVRIEGVQGTGREYNAWFYDVAAFIDAQGNHPRADWQPGGLDLIPMQSVGCVYMVDTIQRSAFYAPMDNEVEHISYCRRVGGVYVDPTQIVYHANLPAYGLGWH